MPENEKVNEILIRGHKLVDEIIELEKLAKKNYEETEYEYFKEIFKDLNKAFGYAGYAISTASANVSEKQIDFWLDILNALNKEETE